jgi:hypothetical protein
MCLCEREKERRWDCGRLSEKNKKKIKGKKNEGDGGG